MIWHAVLIFVQVLGWLTLATTAAAFVAGALHELGEWRARRAREVEELERHLTGLRGGLDDDGAWQR